MKHFLPDRYNIGGCIPLKGNTLVNFIFVLAQSAYIYLLFICFVLHRLLKHLKQNVKNKARVEGSMCNAYLVEESTSFCSYYFEDHVSTVHRSQRRNDDSGVGPTDNGITDFEVFTYPGKPFGHSKKRYLTEEEYVAAHTYILLNCAEVSPYVQ